MKYKLMAIAGLILYWSRPTNWYWSKENRRARKFAASYMAEAKEKGLL